MRTLALDLGVNVGWAKSNGQSGWLTLQGYDDHGEALAVFSDWVERMLDNYKPDQLAVERGFGGKNAVGRLTTSMELTAHMHAFTRCIGRTDRSAGTVRKWLLGYARVPAAVEPSKAGRVRLLDKAVRESVVMRGFMPSNEHAADAAALLCCIEARPIVQAPGGAGT